MFTIFVVEDDPAIAAGLIEIFELLGHIAHRGGGTDQSSEQLAAQLRDVSFDLVMLDLDLGHRDGFELLEHLADAPCPPPIAIASGRDRRIVESARQLAEARGLTVIGTFAKPVAQAQLIGMLDRLRANGRAPAPAVPPEAGAPAPYYMFQSKHALSGDGAGDVIGYEALVRLPGVTDVEGYFAALDPDRAMALTGEAAAAAAELHARLAELGRPVPVAFNCPPDIFGNPAFLTRLRDIALAGGVDPAMLAIELTEQAGSASAIDLASMASRYALAGFQVHLDDFGSGAASLDQMLRLPLREVKIDRAVFRSLLAEGEALLSEIIAHCRKHGIASTIEGIETGEELAVARRAGADHGQGYYWSRPQPIETITGQGNGA